MDHSAHVHSALDLKNHSFVVMLQFQLPGFRADRQKRTRFSTFVQSLVVLRTFSVDAESMKV